MPAMYKSGACYISTNLLRLQNHQSTALVHTQGRNMYMTRLNEGTSPLYEQY